MVDWQTPGVVPELDVTVADWIVSGLEPAGHGGMRVGDLLPGGFEHYARVFHPDQEWNGSKLTVRTWAEIGAEHGVALSPGVTFLEITGYDGESPEQLIGPSSGQMPTTVCRALARVLGTHTTTPVDCLFGIWIGWGSLRPGGLLVATPTSWRERRELRRFRRRERAEEKAADLRLKLIPTAEIGHGRDYLLLRGPVDAACSLQPAGGYGPIPPSLWWPQDRAWVVATEIDSSSTYVGAGADAIRGVVSAHDLEAIEVTLDVPVD